MTLVEITYELQAPLNQEQLQSLGSFANTYGLRKFRVDDARRVAQTLGIDHHVFNYTEEFEKHVVAPFVEGHAQGVWLPV